MHEYEDVHEYEDEYEVTRLARFAYHPIAISKYCGLSCDTYDE